MKRQLFSILMLLCATMTAQADETKMVPLVGNVLNRQTTSLNGEWRYIVDVQESGYYGYRREKIRNGYFRNQKPQKPEDLIEYDFDQSDRMQIPSDWNTRDERLFFYEGTVWFKRSFNYQPKAGHRTLLYFGAVNYEAIVFVNGTEVGRHVGGFTPFNFDVTDLLREGENFVIVKVDNKRSRENVPTLIFDWWNYGGITRDVLLVSVPNTYIENYSLQLNRQNPKLLDFSLQLSAKEAGRQIRLSIPELKLKQTVTTDAEGRATATLKTKKLQLWSPESPKHYRVELSLAPTASPAAPGSVVGDSFADSIGFRTIATRGKQLLLNGQPIFLRDVNDASKMTWEIPYDKPVIISEFGGGAKAGFHGQKNLRFTEEFQENLYRENTAMLDKIDGLAGTTPWILKDFRSPRRLLPGIQDYYNRKGLFSDDGRKKKAFYVLKQWYEGKK